MPKDLWDLQNIKTPNLISIKIQKWTSNLITKNNNLTLIKMKKIITTIALFVAVISSAQGQFEQGMTKAFQLWKEGENSEASDLFERIASADKTSWLPDYYVALVNTTTSFGTQDKTEVNALLTKAQDALDVEMI